MAHHSNAVYRQYGWLILASGVKLRDTKPRECRSVHIPRNIAVIVSRITPPAHDINFKRWTSPLNFWVCTRHIFLTYLLSGRRQSKSAVMNMPEWDAATMPLNGGDPTQMDVNEIYQATGYHAVWIMACTAVVWPIIPGIGLLYGIASSLPLLMYLGRL